MVDGSTNGGRPALSLQCGARERAQLLIKLKNTIKKLNQQIVMITHDREILEDFERILWIDNGKIVRDGSFENVMPDFEKEMRKRANVSD